MTNKKLNKKHIQKQDSTFDVVNKRFPTNASQDIYFKIYLEIGAEMMKKLKSNKFKICFVECSKL